MLFLTKPGTSGQRSKKKKENPNKLQEKEKKKFCVYNSFFARQATHRQRSTEKKTTNTQQSWKKNDISRKPQENPTKWRRTTKKGKKCTKTTKNRWKSTKICQNPGCLSFTQNPSFLGPKWVIFSKKKTQDFRGKDQNAVLFARSQGFTIKNPF